MPRRGSRRTSLLALVLSVLVAGVAADFQALRAETPRAPRPAHHLARGFRNVDPAYSYGVLGRARRLLARGLEGWPERGPAPAVLPNDGAQLRANGARATVTWVGHSTFLVQLDGVNILTDPHWGERASPVAFAGPRRLVPPGLRIEDLPRIDAVVISHDHYDHLDADTVTRLARAHRPRFFVPLGLEPWLADLGVADAVELDWWESRQWRGLTFVAAPAQHSSGRGLHDQNLRLWSSWIVLGRDRRLFFAGDTGYFAGLAEIGRRYGPFDLAAVPVGGYSSWPAAHPNHVNPEEALQLFEDVGGRLMVPMHWGTFELNREPYGEPPVRLLREAVRRGLEERVALLSPGQSIHW
ncbi:MAG TPA: MBL fold metallo-hydrolase [Methylomirabilota bacterium]|nr:MBL fold metallo-hydrolase [Methylomirabilota bacterium]